MQEIITSKPDYEYLLSPTILLIGELNSSISFTQYIKRDEAIDRLRVQREEVKREIIRQTGKYKLYTYEEKTREIVILKDLLVKGNLDIDFEKFEKKKSKANEIRKKLRFLRNSEDETKISRISTIMTELYKATTNVSTISKVDFENDGFRLIYVKKGNSIQATVKDANNKESIHYFGSMARHTMMQLCGYLAFLILLIEENRYPIVSILVLDHISKQFDDQNSKAVGAIFDKFYEIIGKEDFQTFIFDDNSAIDLNIKAGHNELLYNESKTGFIPFYFPSQN